MDDDTLRRLERIVEDQGDNPTVDALLALKMARWNRMAERIAAKHRAERRL